MDRQTTDRLQYKINMLFFLKKKAGILKYQMCTTKEVHIIV